jgi:alpha-beta hydrolase superfamily lysophospholipase
VSTRPARRRGPRRAALALAAVGAIALVAVAVIAGRAVSDPGEAPRAETPGTLLSIEPLTAGIPADARAWRIVHTSRDARDGSTIPVSALVLVPRDPPPGPMPVIAWAHGTTGIERGCAPTLSGSPLFGFPAARDVLARGWAVVATDYPGLGTPGGHPYLVGEAAGRAVLDAIRASRDPRVPAGLSGEVVVWGHSQGAHAALFAGQIAPAYAPDVPLAGVAALAPPTDLPALVRDVEDSPTGKLYLSQAVVAWARHYPALSVDEAIVDGEEEAVAAVARGCLNGPSAVLTLAGAGLLPERILEPGLWRRPDWAAALRANVPAGPVAAPLLIAQGARDQVVPAAQTRADVAARCADDATVRYREYPRADHLSVLRASRAELLDWTAARIAGAAAPRTCPGPAARR